jgi:hypothetical protein
MIKINGCTQRSFVFPAELPMAYAYYTDLNRILTLLPHISIMRVYAYDRFRVLYNTLELGAYHIHILCDLQARLDVGEARVLRILPLRGMPPVRPQAGLTSSTAHGIFSNESVFYEEPGGQTRIDYSLQLRARLPTPLGLRLVPDTVVNNIAESIMDMRVHEIVEGFIENSIQAFPDWLAAMEQLESLPPES